MGYYGIAQICLNGHCITDSAESNPEHKQNFCDQCGAQTITECPECNAAIRGYYHTPGVISLIGYDVPSYCYNCGKPYPWTLSALESAAMLIEEDEKLDTELQGKVVETLQDIIVETPKTQVAVVRLKKALATAGKFTAEGLRQFAIDFGCEFAKKQLGL